MTPADLLALAAAMSRKGPPYHEGDVTVLLRHLPGVVAVAEAAVDMRQRHEGCVIDPPCGSCAHCNLDRAVDAMRAGRGEEGA